MAQVVEHLCINLEAWISIPSATKKTKTKTENKDIYLSLILSTITLNINDRNAFK
jgi:hypothetical protein